MPEPGPVLPHPSISVRDCKFTCSFHLFHPVVPQEWVSESGYGNEDQPPRRPEGSHFDHENHEQYHEQIEDDCKQ